MILPYPMASKMMIVMRRDLGMRKGKIAAQASHAATEVLLRALCAQDRLGDFSLVGEDLTFTDGGRPCDLSRWLLEGVAKVCVYVDGEEALLEIHRRAREAGLLDALILDAGRTEFHGVPTYTCLAIEPADAARVDPITGELPLF